MNCSACGGNKNSGDRCNYCGTLYPEALEAEQVRDKAPVSSLASKYQVERTQDGLCIWWHWRSYPLLALLAFALFWIYLSMGMNSLIPKLLGVAMVAYVTIQFVNRTTIYITRNGISIQHHPVPCRKGYHFIADAVEQIYVSREQRRSNDRTWHAPALQLVTTDGRRHTILKGTSETEFADFESLRRKLLSELGIKARNAVGEFTE